ncbi:MAG: hypothetical protein QMD01_07135 [Thermodesulfovibrionales bacterium]|nr:hypothetical protein [Thermodesulfovibrionales bacterium]
MCKLFKRLLCIIIISWIIFILIAVFGGGEKFRWIGEKTGGVIQKWSDKLADKADNVSKRVSEYKERIRKKMQKKGIQEYDK